MKKYDLLDDLQLLCVTAKSFPDGIADAFEQLKKMLPANEVRTLYGISKPERSGTIIYKAAVAESYDGEAKKYGCETYILKKGEYLTETIIDWEKNLGTIMPTFYKLLDDPQLDPLSPCVEWYRSEDEMVCMVRLK